MFIFLLFALISSVAGDSIVIARTNSSAYLPTLPFPNSVFQHKIGGKQTNKKFVLFDAEYLTEGPGYHIHTRDDELFHVLDGKVQFIVNGSQFCASTGDYVYVPHNVTQGIRVYNPTNTSKAVKIEIMLFPSGLENFLDEIAPLYNNGKDNTEAINNISAKYGIYDRGPVQWKDLGCFDDNFSMKLSSNISLFIFIFLFKHLLE